MDRRNFLRATSAAAVAGAGATTAASANDASAVPAPSILSGVRQLALASWRADPPGEGADRLARRIETATDGRYRIVPCPPGAHPDLSYDVPYRHSMPQRAAAFFAGLPFSHGLDPLAHQAWLAAGGGAMLWDELAAESGLKPLVAGHTGPSSGVWSTSRIDGVSDLAGLGIHVEGLAADVLARLGATSASCAPEVLATALGDGRLQAAEWLGPLARAAPDLQPLAQRLYLRGFNHNGLLISLDVSRPLWDGMSNADRAVFEGCAAHEFQLSLSDARAHGLVAAQVEAPSKWPVRLAWPGEVAVAFEQAASDIIEAIAALDPASRRIHDSYQAFRRPVGEPATV